MVFFRLFDTVAEANANVINGRPIAPNSDPCPPSAPGAGGGPSDQLSVNGPVVCRYAVGPEKGLAMFSYTAKGAHRSYIARWVPDAEPLLRGEMSSENATPLDWTTLKTDWTRLASTP